MIHKPSHLFIQSDGNGTVHLTPEQSLDHPAGMRISQMTFVNAFASFPEGENVLKFRIQWLQGLQGAVSYLTREITLTLETDVRYTVDTLSGALRQLLAKDDVANNYTDKTSDHLDFKMHPDESLLLFETTGVVALTLLLENKRLGLPRVVLGNVPPSNTSDHTFTFMNTFQWPVQYADLNMIPQATLTAFWNNIEFHSTSYQVYLTRSNLLYVACSLSSNTSVHSNVAGAFANDMVCSIPMTGSYGDVIAYTNFSPMPVGLTPQWVTSVDFHILDDELRLIDMPHSWELTAELYYN